MLRLKTTRFIVIISFPRYGKNFIHFESSIIRTATAAQCCDSIQEKKRFTMQQALDRFNIKEYS